MFLQGLHNNTANLGGAIGQGDGDLAVKYLHWYRCLVLISFARALLELFLKTMRKAS